MLFSKSVVLLLRIAAWCMVITVISPLIAWSLEEPNIRPGYTMPRHIRYSFTVQNRTGMVVKDAQFWTHAPVKQTPTQSCLKIVCSHPHEVMTDAAGNQVLHFTFREFPPYATEIISIDADLMLSDEPNKVKMRDFSPYLQSERFIEKDDPLIGQMAKALRKPDDVSTAGNIARWVRENIVYTGYESENRGALWALNNHKGDCTELMHLFAALCRANNIPSRCVEGFILKDKSVLEPVGYHDWAEFFHAGTWRIADPMNDIFMKNQANYIAIRIITNISAKIELKDQLFWYKGDGLNVTMN